MPLSIGQILNNRYRIDALLGQGGMGAVYRAWDSNLGIPVAVKENLDASPEAQKQFSREAAILARLSHPNLPRVTDYFFIPGQGQYLVMDFVEGEDLESMSQRLGALPEPQVLNWIAQVCDALAYLHSQPAPVIHRDIKPSNIKIRPDGRAMLVDFGIAKVYNEHLATTMGAKAVTPGYSPPEQYGGSSTDARSDIYALGATLYRLLTGQTPPESVQRMVGVVALQAPRQLNRQISPMAEQAILTAIQVATDRRFQTVEELRAALTQPGAQAKSKRITGAPSRPATAPDKGMSLPQAGRRNSRLPLVLAAGAGLVIVVALIAFSIFGASTNGSAISAPAVAAATNAPTRTTISNAIDTSSAVPTQTSSVVSVPAVVGQMEARAIALIEASNLKAKLVREPATVCSGIVMRQEPAMWTQVEPGTTITLFGCVGPTPTPQPTSTPSPTASPPPTPMPTATIDADPTVYDNFDNPANEASFDFSRWAYNGNLPISISQKNGILAVYSQGQAQQNVELRARNYTNFTMSAPMYFEAKLMLSPDRHAGYVHLIISVDGWYAQCGISEATGNDAWVSCTDGVWPKQLGHEYSQGFKTAFGKWHKVRIEIDPTTMVFSYFIDEQRVASHIPVDADRIRGAHFTVGVGLNVPSNNEVLGFIDDVRIGQIRR